jgi:hypothetical protein
MTQCLANPLCLFLVVWGTATILYFSGVLAGTFPFPRFLTVEAFLLNITTFSLGYLTWTLFHSLPLRSTGRVALPAIAIPLPGEAACPPFTRRRLTRALQFALLMGVAALLMELYRIAAMAAYYNTSWSYLVTHPSVLRLRLVMFISASMYQTSYTVILLSLTNSIFSIGFALLGLFLYLDRTWWKYLYLSAFLGISLTIGLMHLSRCEVTGRREIHSLNEAAWTEAHPTIADPDPRHHRAVPGHRSAAAQKRCVRPGQPAARLRVSALLVRGFAAGGVQRLPVHFP